MRFLHRWIAPVAILFLTLISATGIYMQVNALWNTYHPEARATPQTLPAEEIARWLDAAVGIAQREHPQHAIALVSLSMDRDRPRADVIWTDPNTPALSIDPRSGTVFQSIDRSPSSFRTLSRWMLQVHRGDILGSPGRWLGLACGIALFLLGFSGISLYLKLYRQRIRLKRWSPWW